MYNLFITHHYACIDSTDYTTYLLNFGHHPKPSLDQDLPYLNDQMPAKAIDYVSELMTRLETTRNISLLLVTIRKAHMVNKSIDQSHAPHSKIGDVVYMFINL